MNLLIGFTNTRFVPIVSSLPSYLRIEIVSFEQHFKSGKESKVAESYIRTVLRPVKLYELAFCSILLHKVPWMRWRIIVMNQPINARQKLWLSSNGLKQSFQYFNVVSFSECAISWSIFLVPNTINQNSQVSSFCDRAIYWSIFTLHNTLKIKQNNQRWLHINSFRASFSKIKAKLDTNWYKFSDIVNKSMPFTN